MSDQRAFVIGMGEVGRRLAGALERAGWTVLPVTRDEGWQACQARDDEAPRIVAVREEALSDVLVGLGRRQRERLVLVQNGFLEAVHGDLGPVTRGLIWFTSKGDFFRELRDSPFHGPQAPRLVEALRAGGLQAELVDEAPRYLREMIVKGAWNCVVGLPVAVHGTDLESYLAGHGDELRAIIAEATAVAAAEYGVEVPAAEAVTALLDTTAELGWVRGGAKALAWRNGAVARLGRKHDVPTPTNDELLRAVDWDPDSFGHWRPAPRSTGPEARA